MKFFGDSCISYFLLLSRRIDRETPREKFEKAISTLPKLINEELMMKIPNSSSHCKNVEISHESEGGIRELTALSVMLELECGSLQKALYSIPVGVNEIPQIFRDAEPPNGGGNTYSMDDDGFEVI